MADSSVLKEFFIRLGWKVDTAQEQKFQASIRAATTQGVLLGNLISEAVSKATEAVIGLGSSFEKLSYSSTRTKSSIEDLKAFSYAASQLGSNAEEAVAAVEGLQKRIRDAPGYRTMLSSLGVDVTASGVEQLRQTLAALNRMPSHTRTAYANVLGIPDTLLDAFKTGQFNKWMEDYRRSVRAIGVDMKTAGEDGVDFAQQLRSMWKSVDLIAMKVFSTLLKDAGGGFKTIGEYLDKYGGTISTAIVDAIKWLKDLAVELFKIVGGGEGLRELFTTLTTGIVKMTRAVKGLYDILKSLFAFLNGWPAEWLGWIMGIKTGTPASGEGTPSLGAKPGSAPGSSESDFWGGISIKPGGRADRFRNWLGRTFSISAEAATHPGGGNPQGDGGAQAARIRDAASRGRGRRDMQNVSPENAQAIRDAAKELGTTPEELATVISYETAGTFSTGIWGGKGGRYAGLIQFGASERRQFGAYAGQPFKEQLAAAVRFLKARGFKPGMGLLDLYSTINAGRPGRYGASDGNGTVRSHVAAMVPGHAANVRKFLAGGQGASPVVSSRNDPKMAPLVITGKPGAAPQPATPFGGLIPLAPTPLTGGSTTNSSVDRSVSMNPVNHINIYGSSSPGETGAAVGRAVGNVNTDLLRNMQGAAQ